MNLNPCVHFRGQNDWGFATSSNLKKLDLGQTPTLCYWKLSNLWLSKLGFCQTQTRAVHIYVHYMRQDRKMNRIEMHERQENLSKIIRIFLIPLRTQTKKTINWYLLPSPDSNWPLVEKQEVLCVFYICILGTSHTFFVHARLPLELVACNVIHTFFQPHCLHLCNFDSSASFIDSTKSNSQPVYSFTIHNECGIQFWIEQYKRARNYIIIFSSL